MMARHVASLSLVSVASGLHPDLDVARGQPIAAALGAMITYDAVTRTEPAPTLPMLIFIDDPDPLAAYWSKPVGRTTAISSGCLSATSPSAPTHLNCKSA